ncbi:Os05g0185400 [Oryza sativa Japonica Group]|uniref:Os05g0185400 protein n=1 Tax=Oryza sativa subsp. japonica TaxID=39947 RepID=A0A0P0WIR9_ORYSJ|nr:Os05g0185400 [Oryza sativa Japonica Group]
MEELERRWRCPGEVVVEMLCRLAPGPRAHVRYCKMRLVGHKCPRCAWHAAGDQPVGLLPRCSVSPPMPQLGLHTNPFFAWRGSLLHKHVNRQVEVVDQRRSSHKCVLVHRSLPCSRSSSLLQPPHRCLRSSFISA